MKSFIFGIYYDENLSNVHENLSNVHENLSNVHENLSNVHENLSYVHALHVHALFMHHYGGQVVKRDDFINMLNYLIISLLLSGVGSSPAHGICKTSQVLLVSVIGVFSCKSTICIPPTDWPISYGQK